MLSANVYELKSGVNQGLSQVQKLTAENEDLAAKVDALAKVGLRLRVGPWGWGVGLGVRVNQGLSQVQKLTAENEDLAAKVHALGKVGLRVE